MYIVMNKTAHMPNSVKAHYRRVAVVEVDSSELPTGRTEPHAISTHYKGCKRIVRTWERLHAGTNGGNTAFDRAMREAKKLCKQLNKKLTTLSV